MMNYSPRPYVAERDEQQMIRDITAPQAVEIEIRRDGQVVWVHVDGVTAFRACRIGTLIVTDHRDSELAERDAIDQIQRDVNRTRTSKDICDND